MTICAKNFLEGFSCPVFTAARDFRIYVTSFKRNAYRKQDAMPHQQEQPLHDRPEPTARPRLSLVGGSLSFLKRQKQDWIVTVVRTSLDKLAYQMVFPYLSVYIVALGATGTQLGLVNSLAMIVAGIPALFVGWLIDQKGPKKIYLAGIALLAVSYLTYGLAQNLVTALVAMITYWIGTSTSGQSCSTICGNCLVNQDRATGMMICETVAAGLLGMAGPMLAAWIVSLFGGVHADGIRPLFFVGLAVTAVTFVIVKTRLSDRQWCRSVSQPHLIRDIAEILKGRRQLKKWLIIASITQLPLGMVFPFTQAFAHSVKGAQEFVLGAMVTGSALSSILLSIPIGRMADVIGRKKILYGVIPLFWMSNLVLIWAPSPVFLIVAGILQGFYFIGAPIAASIERELVPSEHMGRWLGTTRFCKMTLSGCLALASGVIWDRVGPQYIFISFVAIDLLIRMPLLIGMPETLHARFKPPGN